MDIKQLIDKFSFGDKYLPFSDFDVSNYLEKHDVVFRTPQLGGYEGLPLGNGDISIMQWTTEDGLRLAINKNDVWTQPDEEAPMQLRSCGRLEVCFGRPLNDWLYLQDFETRLSIGEAKATYKVKTPFCRVDAQTKVDTESNLIVIDIDFDDMEPSCETELRFSLERYGSRAFRSWYASVERNVSAGLGRPTSGVVDDIIYITEVFSGEQDVPVSLAAVLLPKTNTKVECRRRNSRCAELLMSFVGKVSATLLVAVESGTNGTETLRKAIQTLHAAREDILQVEVRHRSWWRDYWNRSFLHLTKEGEEVAYDYLENLYYIQLYALACASRGEYPMLFNGGTFLWNRDVRNWVNPHHWNLQQSYWALEAANRPELVEPYLKAYIRIMPQAREYARKMKKVSRGIVISEMHDFAGRMLGHHGALTPASQIAMQFWNHYLYNPDKELLYSYVYPFIKECADFYAEYARWDDERKEYIISPASPYECPEGECFTNTVSDLTMVRYIVPKAIYLAQLLGMDEDRVQVWNNLLNGISDYRYLEEPTGEVLAAFEEGDGLPQQGHVFCRNISPLVPCPILTYRDKGTRLYNAVLNALRKYTRQNVSHTPSPVAWARVGNGARAVELLFNAAEQLQHFRQGFYYNLDHWYIYSRYWQCDVDYLTECQRDYVYDKSLEYKGVKIINGEDDERIDLPMEPFIQPGFETPGILTHTLHEMLLQSHEGVIRIAPAIPPNISGCFTLKAAGGFMVSAWLKYGNLIPAIFVKSLYGGICEILVPFDGRDVVVILLSSGKDIQIEKGEGIHFETQAGETYMIIAEDAVAGEIEFYLPDHKRNNDEKVYGKATIGRKRMF